MSRPTPIVVLALLFASSAVPADEKADRVKKLKEQIAETEKKLADLKKELAKEEPEVKYTDAKESLWETTTPDIGTRGYLSTEQNRVVEVIDSETAVIQLGTSGPGVKFLVRGLSTEGWVDNMSVRCLGKWNVVTTRKHGGQTLMALRPADGARIEKLK